jgi:hypothetical protein
VHDRFPLIAAQIILGSGMADLFKRTKKIPATLARKITGISLPFGGITWADAGPGDPEVVRRFLVFLEDRRVLYNPMWLEEVSQVDRSVHEIREQCTEALKALAPDALAVPPIRAIRSAARRYFDERNEQFRFFDRGSDRREGSPGFFVALGGFRATVGQQVAMLAAHYDVDVEGELASVILQPEDAG